jgi:hypothetical protein
MGQWDNRRECPSRSKDINEENRERQSLNSDISSIRLDWIRSGGRGIAWRKFPQIFHLSKSRFLLGLEGLSAPIQIV